MNEGTSLIFCQTMYENQVQKVVNVYNMPVLVTMFRLGREHAFEHGIKLKPWTEAILDQKRKNIRRKEEASLNQIIRRRPADWKAAAYFFV
jgi:hypothetical protein